MNLRKRFYDDYIWGLKYRSKTINDCILPDRLKSDFGKVVDQNEIDNMIFYGPPGTGKTSVAIILSELFKKDTYYLNASMETGIDNIRNNLTQFVSSRGIFEEAGKKLVLLDECLEENESILIGNVNSPDTIKLKDMELGKSYPIISYNTETMELEEDTGEIISDKTDEVFEIVLEDGKKIKCNRDHPFFIEQNGKLVEIKMGDLSIGDHILTIDNFLVGDYILTVDKMVRIKSITSIGTSKVRNLTVNKNHTFVTANGIVSHNCDRLSLQSADSIKVFLEEYSKTTSFIFITNHINKISEAIMSRLQGVDFQFTREESEKLKKEFFKTTLSILKKENVEFNSKVVAHVVKSYFPDMRKTLNELQKFHKQGSLNDLNLIKTLRTDISDFYEIAKKADFFEMVKYIANITDANVFYSRVFESYLNFVDESSIPEMIFATNKYHYECSCVIDHRLNLTAYALELMNNIKFK